jgi:hypothetical protein
MRLESKVAVIYGAAGAVGPVAGTYRDCGFDKSISVIHHRLLSNFL